MNHTVQLIYSKFKTEFLECFMSKAPETVPEHGIFQSIRETLETEKTQSDPFHKSFRERFSEGNDVAT